MAYVLLVTALLLNASANTLLKIGASHFHDAPDAGLFERFLGNHALWMGLLLFALNAACYVVALGQLKLSVAYPVMAAGSLVVVALSSVLWLGESLTTLQWSGIALLLLGIVLVAAPSAT